MSKNGKKRRPRGLGSYSEKNKLINGRKAKRKFCGSNLLKILEYVLERKKKEK